MGTSWARGLINVSQSALSTLGTLPESEQISRLREAHEVIIKICKKLCTDATEEHKQQVASSGAEIRPLVARLLPTLLAEKKTINTAIVDIKDQVIHDTVRDILLLLLVDGILQFVMDQGTITQQQYDELRLGQQKFFSAYNFGEEP